MVCQVVQRGFWVMGTLAGVAIRLALAANQPDATPVSYTVSRSTAEQGLPQNNIRALLQTRDGYLWVGTLAGLARFDGVKFKVFDLNNTPALRNDAINALAEDREDGSLWINSGQGLLRYHQHRFERFDEEQGFPQPFGSLWPARQGGLWYSPHPGQLVRLQHRTVQSWQLQPRRSSEGGDEIIGHCIQQVQEEDDTSLLVLMYTGLFRFEPVTGAVKRLGPPVATDTSCRGVSRWVDGTILVATREGLWRLRGQSRNPEAPDRDARPAAPPSESRVPAGPGPMPGAASTARSDQPGWEKIEAVAPDDRQCPAQIIPSRDGAWWIAWSLDGPPRLARFRDNHSEMLDLSGLPDYPMFSFCEDAEGNLWLGTESGLVQLRPKPVQVYSRKDGLRNDFVRAVTEGSDGTIWLGTAEGVSGIKEGQVTNLPPIQSPAYWGWAEGLLADRRGRVWYGGYRNEALVFDGNAWISPAPLSMGEHWIRTLYEDRVGRIWAGFDGGVLCLDEAGTVRPGPTGLSHPDVRAIHQDRRGDLWFGTYGGGLNRLHDGQITSFATTRGEYNNRAWCIHEDADGIFWVGSRSGLNRFVPPDPDAPLPSGPPAPELGSPPSSPSTKENRISSEKPGSHLLPPATAAGTRRAGAPSEQEDRFFTFTQEHGLHESIINNIQEDDLGYLWLSGQQGIYRVARQELNEVAARRQARAQVLAFGEADGMLNSQCNGGANQPAGCKDRAGRIWFPTARGVAMIDPRAVRRNDLPPPVIIEQVVADDEVIYGDGSQPPPRAVTSETRITSENPTFRPRPFTPTSKPLRDSQALEAPPSPILPCQLAPGRARVLEMRYTANSFAAPHRMRFKYRLDGHDRDWRFDDGNQRVAYYTNLRPGRYTFRVTACNNHGVWSTTPAVFAFTLAPHFWQTWLFYVLVGAGVIGGAAAVQAWRLHWQRRLLKLEQQQALSDERTRIARDLHDDLGTALTGLALQMDVLRLDAHESPAWSSRLAESAALIRGLAERMREVVWAVNPRCDTVSSLASFLEQQAGHFLKADGLRCRLEFPEDIPPLPLDGESRYQLALGVREALTNVVRHAGASEIVLGLAIEADHLIVRVADNGRGFRVSEGMASGRGLANVHARLQKIGGLCACHSAEGVGTTMTFRVPLTRRQTS